MIIFDYLSRKYNEYLTKREAKWNDQFKYYMHLEVTLKTENKLPEKKFVALVRSVTDYLSKKNACTSDLHYYSDSNEIKVRFNFRSHKGVSANYIANNIMDVCFNDEEFKNFGMYISEFRVDTDH